MNMPRPSWMWIYGVVVIFILGYWMLDMGTGAPVKSDWNTVSEMIERGDVEKIQVINRDRAEVYLKSDAVARYRTDATDKRFRNMPETGVQLTFNIGSVDTFRQDLDKVMEEWWESMPPSFLTSAQTQLGKDELLGYIDHLNKTVEL